jgi:hypothetical protein
MQKKGCGRREKEIYWAFADCFADGAKLDDPALEAKLDELRAAWRKQREPGSEILLNARLALRTARAKPTAEGIARGRESVFAFGRQQEALRAVLQSSFAAFPGSAAWTGRTAAILTDTRRQWSRDIEAQNQNYIGLLEELARLSAGLRSADRASAGQPSTRLPEDP